MKNTKLTMMLLSSLLMACGGHPTHKKQMKTYVVHSASIHKTLYFTGNVQPLQETSLVSPMDAVVDTMHYRYGQYVKKGQEVFTLNSVELQKQYNEMLTEYLKAKDSYTIARAKFTGTEDLWKAGLLSKNNYLSEKSSLNTSRLSLMQASRKLTEMLEKMGENTYQDLSSLSFAEFAKVRQTLNDKHNLIHLKSPISGLLLYPPKAADDKSGRITVGAPTKAGQVLGLIGDLSGMHVDIDVPEIDIDKIKLGMPATVHGVAFAKQELKGTLVFINAEASANSGGALPSFNAIVEVKGLNKQQQSLIKVGMSASIELAIDSVNKLLVPIAAVRQQQGKSTVKLQHADGSTSLEPVVTGAVHEDKVVIDSGLKEGDVILYE